MSQIFFLVLFGHFVILVSCNVEPFIPSSFNFSTLGVLAANGSSAVAGCSNVTQNVDTTSTCNIPTTSVLFDRNTPTLAGLNGDTWASQFMIYYTPEFGVNNFYLYSDFISNLEYTHSRRVEVTIFNCPRWGTGVESIQVLRRSSTTYLHLTTAYPTSFSCTSLVRICIPFRGTSSRQMGLYFSRYSGVQHVHIAEIAFYSSDSPCLPFTTIPGANDYSQTTVKTITLPTTIEKSAQNTSVSTGQADDESLVEVKLQGSSTVLILLAVQIVILVLLASFIFTLILVLVAFKYKWSKRCHACRRDKTCTTNRVFAVEDRFYDSVTVEEHGVVSTSGQEKRSAIQLKKNAAYVS